MGKGIAFPFFIYYDEISFFNIGWRTPFGSKKNGSKTDGSMGPNS
jgi:hypothetical protein